MIAYYKRPGDAGQKIIMEKFDLGTLQALCGGYIEVTTFARGILIICNEEAIINDLEYNFCGIFGPILFVRQHGEDFASLTDKDVESIRSLFKEEGNDTVRD